VKTEESSLLMLSFPLSEDALLIGLACGEQMVEDACQLMGSRGNSLWSAKFGAHARVKMAKNRLVVMQRVSGDAERNCGAFCTWRVRTESILPPLIRLSGHRPSHEANAAALRNLDKSGPTSASKV
jgi:hypothetical protein